MGAGKTYCCLVADPALSGPTDWKRRWWRSLHHTESGTQDVGAWSPSLDGDLDTQDKESDGLVLLVPRVQAGRVFSGYLAGGIDSQIAERSGMACLQFSIVVRTER